MPANGFNIGKDVVVDIVTSAGLLRAAIRTGFTSRQMTTSLEVKAADGRNLFSELPAGWEGSFDYERGNADLDDYFAAREADYYGGLADPAISITETIKEVNGSISQYRYTGVALKYDDTGMKGQSETIKQKVSFKCARRIKVT